MRLGCALSSLTHLRVQDAVEAVANAGFAGVEVSFGATDVDETIGAIRARGLEICSLAAVLQEAAVAGLSAAGRLGLGAVVLRCPEGRGVMLDELAAVLRDVGREASGAGVRILLANRRDGRIEQIEDLRYLLGQLPAETFGIAADVGEFQAASVNVCHVFREFPGRIGLVRIGDCRGRDPVPLGQGDVNLSAVVRAAKGLGYAGWLVLAPHPDDCLGNARRQLMRLLAAEA